MPDSSLHDSSVNRPARLLGTDRTPPNAAQKADCGGGVGPHGSARRDVIAEPSSRKTVARPGAGESQNRPSLPRPTDDDLLDRYDPDERELQEAEDRTREKADWPLPTTNPRVRKDC
jgi:hypothetical protein